MNYRPWYSKHNGKKDNLNSFTQSIFDTYNHIILKWYKEERIYKHIPTARNTDILFHEQTVCKRVTKKEKCLLDEQKVK